MSVNYGAMPGGIIGIYSLELPQGGGSNKYTQHTITYIKGKSPQIIPNIIMSAAMGFFHRDSRTSSEQPW